MARYFLCVLVVTLASAPPLAAQSLVHLWAFNGDYNDTSGSGNHGTPSGNPMFVPGKFGQGVSLASPTLDGVDLHFGANNLPLNGTDPWSMNVWAKFAEAPGQLEYLAGFGIDDGFIAADVSAVRAIIAFGGATANNFYFWGGSNDVNSGVPYSVDNQWHMYTVTYDGTDLRMYKDGSQAGGPTAKTFANAFDEVHVGNPSHWNSNFDGQLDEFAIYHGALSEAQIGGLFFNNDINQPVILDPTFTIHRDTGQILFTNDSSFPIELLGYTIRSASGSLDPTQWSTVMGRFDAAPGDGSIDNDPWTVFTNQSLEYSVELSEGVPGTDGGTIAIGKVVDFGNAWVKNPVEDVVIDLLLDDGMGTVKTLAASFTGNGDASHILADYNGNGTIDAADWTHFRSAGRADLTGATETEAYYGGDLDGDFDKDINDFSLFVRRYELFNGAGSFANLASVKVPEPATCLLALTLLGSIWALRRGSRTATRLSLALLAHFAAASTASAALWGYYPLNSDANESTGNNINLNLVGDASFGGTVHPGLGSALQLDGNGDGAIGPNFNKFVSNDATVMAWAYANNTDNAWDSIVKNWGAGATGQFHLGLGPTAENTLQNHLNTGPATATDPFPLEQWVHTAFVADSAAGQHRLYMNGVVVATAAYAGTLVPGAATGLGIGVKPNDDGTTTVSNAPGFWNGRIDDVALFDVAMSDAEIMTIYQNGLQGIQVDGTTVPYITLQVDRGTGMATLTNTTGGDVDLTAYQIQSPSGDLRVGEWENLAGNSGFPTGNGSGNGWENDGASGATQLLETYLTGSSIFASGRTIDLGEIFTPGGHENLEFSYRLGSGAVIDSLVNYVGVGPTGLLGDFNDDGVVDTRDFVVWRNNLNGSDEVLNGNGNNTGSSMGVIDADDYLVWKNHYGDTSGGLQLPATAVPEPWSGPLLAFVVGGALVALSRQGSRAHV